MHIRRAATTLLSSLLLGVLPSFLGAQSTTRGTLEGTVRTATGAALSQVRVTVQSMRGGLPRALMTDVDGRFEAPLLEPGSYEVLAEQLGYKPVLLGPVAVRAGREVSMELTLRPVEGVVEAPERAPFDAGVAGASRPGRSRVFTDWERAAVPYREGDVRELLSTTSEVQRSLSVEGLPSEYEAVTVDGVPVRPLTQESAYSGSALSSLLLPIPDVGGAELLTGTPDVAWPSAAGGLLALSTVAGPRGVGGAVSGDFGSDALSIDDTGAFSSWRGAGSLGGSFAADSGHAWVGVRALRREQPIDYLPAPSAAVVQGLTDAGLDLSRLSSPAIAAEERRSAAATFDWSFSTTRSVRVAAMYADGRSDRATGFTGVPLSGSATGHDFLGLISATAGLGDDLSLQARFGYGSSRRESSVTGGVDTRFGKAAVAFLPAYLQLGDPELPAELNRSSVYGDGTLHWTLDRHRLKLGAAFSAGWHDWLQGSGGDGVYLFGDVAHYTAGQGAFFGTTAGSPGASFMTQEYALFAQDSWRLAPGLDLRTGLRYQLEVLPTSDLGRNRRWEELTGIDNTDVNRYAPGVGFTAGFEWDVQQTHRWLVRADATIRTGEVLPAVLAEGLSRDGRTDAIAAVGDVGGGLTPEPLGARLTVLDPSVDPPVTTRASFGISHALGAGMVFHVGGVLRQTENLTRRHDLNLRTDLALHDQYDRPLFGPLAAAGSILQAEPGANRRFGEFDAVSAITTDGSSTYWGVTAMVEKQAGDLLRLAASYTYSGTRDDLADPVPGSGELALSPFAGLDEFVDWQDGRSAYDVPHRAAGTAELRIPFLRAVAIGGTFGVSSGRPFTPGFGPGIDANADGVSGNDPAFVDPDLPGMEELMGSWDCLRNNAGRFAERNACRLPVQTSADAWLAVRLPAKPGGPGGELRVEVLDLEARGWGVYDTALSTLDPEGALSVDGTTVEVPLMVNPDFGKPLLSGNSFARVRISTRLWF